ncbi:MAG TPA: hypothetical protein DHV48_13885 [Prolixibacteraceae bacterium]|nr:hypothetical protein [Prolixibacteraceae bacterium]
MNRGYIKIKETEHQKFVVEVQIADGNLWLTKHEIADVFNVPISVVSNSLRSILKSGLLREEEVTCIHLFDRNGKQCQTIIYNLEALIFISYRVASGEAKVFRQWVMKILCKNTIDIKRVFKGEVMVDYKLMKDLSIISILN